MSRVIKLSLLGTMLAIASLAYLKGYKDHQNNTGFGFPRAAMAEDQKRPKVTPTGQLRDPNIFYPGTEEIAPDEMRVFSCGTGMPTARESQAATCWLLELGNGDKFIFDAGTGSAPRIASMGIPYDYLDKIFISHLHTDHFGDFAAYFIGGWVAGTSARLWPQRCSPGTGNETRDRSLGKSAGLGRRRPRRTFARVRRQGHRARI